MNYIFLDLEWNQPCGKNNAVTKPVPLYGEIVRIGAVKLDDKMTELSRFHCCVVPKYYKQINRTVKMVTGLSTTAITYGKSFALAYSDFRKWLGSDCVILTWGTEDERNLRSNMTINKISDSLPEFYDLQLMFTTMILENDRQCSLQKALEYYALEQELAAHNALNDAIYAARIGVKMNFIPLLEGYNDMLRQIELYKSEKYVCTYTNLKSIDKIISNRKIMQCSCPCCGKTMQRKKWLAAGSNMLITCAECPEHGEYFLSVKMKTIPDGSYVATRRTRRLTTGCREFYSKSIKENKTEIKL